MENESNINQVENLVTTEKKSQKEIDVFCRELLSHYPELHKQIINQMHFYAETKIPMPVIHITSKAIHDENGTELRTGFIENIKKSGFRKRNTNVGAFVERGKTTTIAQPDYFSAHPEDFIKSLRLFLARYIHHGSRTNKDALLDQKNKGYGFPAMIIINGNVQLEHGSDYDDHYILPEGSGPQDIIGEIDLSKHNYHRSEEDITYIVEEMLKQTADYYKEKTDKADKMLV